jgi:putative transposase
MDVGLFIGLEGPGWIGAMMGLANTFLNKVKFCAEYNAEIEENQWPCKGLPQSLIADRGELEGMNADYLAETLGIDVINDPPYRADLKGIIEQKFDQIEESVLYQLPGVVKDRYRERGEKDYRPEAALTLEEFTTIIINTIIDYNCNHYIHDYSRDEFMIHEFVEPVPIKLWEWGIKNRSGHFREKSEDIIRMALMPKDTAQITFKGIRFKGMHYSSKKGIEEQWFQKAKRYGGKSIRISYDPRRLNQIFILSDDGKEFETCELLAREERFKNHHLEEVKKLLEYEQLQEDIHNQTKAQTTAVLHSYAFLCRKRVYYSTSRRL